MRPNTDHTEYLEKLSEEDVNIPLNIWYDSQLGAFIVSRPADNARRNQENAHAEATGLWPHEMEELLQWARQSDNPSIGQDVIPSSASLNYNYYFRPHNPDHFVVDGSSLCETSIKVPSPLSPTIRPLSDLSADEYFRATGTSGGLCDRCESYASKLGKLPFETLDGTAPDESSQAALYEDIEREIPETNGPFDCPICSLPLADVDFRRHDVAFIHQSDAEDHTVAKDPAREWRRYDDASFPNTDQIDPDETG